jgi:hypothetical protein
MIVVNVSQSYASLMRKERTMLFAELSTITTGDWPPMADSTLDGFLDYLVGTYNDVIVTAFEILSVKRVIVDGKEKIQFEVLDWRNNESTFESAAGLSPQKENRAAWLIGCPIPGGQWKRGEARGTRRYAMDAYMEDHPELADRRDGTFPDAMAENLFALLKGDARVPAQDFPALAQSTQTGLAPTIPGGVKITRQPDGTVVIVVPTGTKATLSLDPNQSWS